jgi:hypothetical protein
VDADVGHAAAWPEHPCSFRCDIGEVRDIGMEQRAGNRIEGTVFEGQLRRIGL